MNPWLTVPVSEYEGHMQAVGQFATLNEIFADVYRTARPRRLAVLGCAAGNGFEHIEPSITERIVGVDINPHYIELALRRFGNWGNKLQFVCGDVLAHELEPAAFDMVHAALLFEYVDPNNLFQRIATSLTAGGLCSIVLQLQNDRIPTVSVTAFQSLQALSTIMQLRQPKEITRLAIAHSLALLKEWEVPLPNAKQFWVGLFSR